MGVKIFSTKYIMQFLALISLILALRDGAVLLGVGSEQSSPIVKFGFSAYILMAAFAIFRLFSSVGMWIGARWGAPLQIIVIIAEFSILFSALINIYIGSIGFSVRLILLFAIIALYIFHYFRNLEKY